MLFRGLQLAVVRLVARGGARELHASSCCAVRNVARGRRVQSSPSNCIYPNLEMIGQLTEPLVRNREVYRAGQFFIHSTLGYRGIVLFPWRADVYKYSLVRKKKSADEYTTMNPKHLESVDEEMEEEHSSLNVIHHKVIQQQQYCVIYEKKGVQDVNICGTGARTWVNNGVDLITHAELVPFVPCRSTVEAFTNDHFSSFFTIENDGTISARSELEEFAASTQLRRGVAHIYQGRTGDVAVSAMPINHKQRKNEEKHSWVCFTKIENKGKLPIKVLSMTEMFEDAVTGVLVRKSWGVGGMFPVIQPASSFQCSLPATLNAPQGIYRGRFAVVEVHSDGSWGKPYDCNIPHVILSQHNSSSSSSNSSSSSDAKHRDT